MNGFVCLGRRAAMPVGVLLLCALPVSAFAENIWKATFGQAWFWESRSSANQAIAGTWWEASLTPGATYQISFEVNHLSGSAGLYVGGRSRIGINRTGWHSYEFNIWKDGPRKMMFTSGSNNMTLGVRKIVVKRKWGSGGSASPAGNGGAMPKGHYLAFSRDRNLKTEMLDLIDNPRTAQSGWHLDMAREIHDGLTTPGIRGFQIRLDWKNLEVGDGRFDWRMMDGNMAVARRLGLKYIVQVATRTFDGSNPMPGYFPKQYSIWWQGNGQSGYVAKLWDPWVYNRLIRLYKAIAARYSGDAAFGGIATDETALGNLSGGNYSYWKYRTALIEIATKTQSALKHGRLFMYMNFVKGGDNYDMRKDGRVDIVRNIPQYAVAVGGPDITPDLPGMVGNMASYRIHLRKNYPQVEQFCHAMHIDQGAGNVNRKSNTQRRAFADTVRQVRQRESQSWFDGQRAIFEFDDLRDPNGKRVDYHPDWVLGKLWAPAETFAYATRNFRCDYFLWNFRDSMFANQTGYWWPDVRPVVVNNQYYYN